MNKRRRKVMIVGAGGHANVVQSILVYSPEVEIVGFADREPRSLGERIGDAMVVSTWDRLEDWRREGVTAIALAIGNNHERARLYKAAKETKYEIIGAVHPRAFVERNVALGEGAIVCAGAILGAGVRLGVNTLVNTGAVIDHGSWIGDHAHVGPGARLAGRVRVGSLTFVGIGSTVRDSISIGANVIVGAGSVVVTDIPDDVVAYGVPARVRDVRVAT